MSEVLEYGKRPNSDAEWLAVISTVHNNLDLIKATMERRNHIWDDAWTWEEGCLIWYATLAAELIKKQPERHARLRKQILELANA